MTIQYIESLSRKDGLRLHEAFSHFSGVKQSMVLVIDGSKAIAFGGKLHRNMVALAENLNDILTPLGDDIVGFAGKKILSCHFRKNTYARFNKMLGIEKPAEFMVQLPSKSIQWQEAVIRWGNHYNATLAARTPPATLIQVAAVPDKPGMINIIFPDMTSLSAFEFKLNRGHFDMEARISAATSKPAQRAA